MRYSRGPLGGAFVVVILVMALVPSMSTFVARESSHVENQPRTRFAKTKWLMRDAPAFQGRGPASLSGRLDFEEPGGALASLMTRTMESRGDRSRRLDDLEAAWTAAGERLSNRTGDEERAEQIRLCKNHLAFACERYYHQERIDYFEAVKKARAMASPDARDEKLERLKLVKTRLDLFARQNCLSGSPFVCQDVVDAPVGGDLMTLIKSYCLGGEIDYCLSAGFALLNRWVRAREKEASAPHADVVLDEARAFMAKGCEAGDVEACSELIQGPLAEMSDARTITAVEAFSSLCAQGDPTACVAVAGARYDGDRQRVAQTVVQYCDMRRRSSKPVLSEEEELVCSRLDEFSADHLVSDQLWKEMVHLMYEGPHFSAKVLDHLAPVRDVAFP